MAKFRKSLRPNQSTVSVEENNSKLDFIKIAVFLISFIGVLLVLLGYGYLTGLGSQFGYLAAEIVNDKSDFLSASAMPLAAIFSNFFSWTFWKDILCSWEWVHNFIAGSTFLAILLYLLLRYGLRSPNRKRAVRNWLNKNSVNVMDRIVFEDNLFKGFIKVLFAVPLFLSGIAFTIFYTIAVVLFLIVIIPVIGMEEGKKDATEYIVNAEVCAARYMTLKDRDPNIKSGGKGAICVRLIQNNKEVVRGRVIATTNRRIFLYVKAFRLNDKQEKEEIRVPKSYPIRNVIIERVETEDI